MQRRRFLTVIGTTSAIALAGCSSDDTSDDGGNGNNGDTEQDPTTTPTPDSDEQPTGNETPSSDITVIADERSYTVPEGGYRGRAFSLTRTATVTWEGLVRSGPAVDFILMPQSEVDHYENGERFRYSSDGSDMDTTNGSGTITLERGDYVLAIDNTDVGEATPPTNGETTAEVELTITAE